MGLSIKLINYFLKIVKIDCLKINYSDNTSKRKKKNIF